MALPYPEDTGPPQTAQFAFTVCFSNKLVSQHSVVATRLGGLLLLSGETCYKLVGLNCLEFSIHCCFLFFSFFLLLVFLFFFEIECHYIALAILELDIQTRRALNLETARIKVVSPQACPVIILNNATLFPQASRCSAEVCSPALCQGSSVSDCCFLLMFQAHLLNSCCFRPLANQFYKSQLLFT